MVAAETGTAGDAWSQAGVGPVQLGDLCGRPPRGVDPTGLDEQVEADLVDTVRKEETGRALGDQRLVPWPQATGDLAPGDVEGEDGGAEVADRPGPLRLEPAAPGA